MTCHQRFIEIKNPPRGRIEGIHDAAQSSRFHMYLGEPATSHNTDKLLVLFRQDVGAWPAIGLVPI